jgi:ABC-2 type transport system ATP-binding protein
MSIPAENFSDQAIEMVGLTKRFGHTLAVNNLSLNVPRGCTYGLLGPNGAGKSTTIKMLMGMLSISSGTARVLNIDVQADPVQVKQRVGYVPESHYICRWMRVREVLGFCKSCYPTWNDATCRELVEMFGLDLEKKVKHLSKGTQVKLALLLAVSHDPELLLLDEPLSGLDPIAREEFLDGVLQTICQRGQTVLISSHMLDDVRRLADTVGILNEGQLLVQGNVDELLRTMKRIRATLRDGQKPSQSPEGTIWQRVQGREWTITVRDFSPEKVQQVLAIEGVENAAVIDLGLEELFKDIIRGQRGTP